MLRVTVEILPGGDSSDKRIVGHIEATNINDLSEVSDYSVQLFSNDEDGKLNHYNAFILKGHRRSDGWTELLRKVLEYESR